MAVDDETIPAIPGWAACAEDVQIRMVLALGRLALGSMVEAVLSISCVLARGVPPIEITTSYTCLFRRQLETRACARQSTYNCCSRRLEE